MAGKNSASKEITSKAGITILKKCYYGRQVSLYYTNLLITGIVCKARAGKESTSKEVAGKESVSRKLQV